MLTLGIREFQHWPTQVADKVAQGERVILTRHGVPICAVVSLGDLEALEAREEKEG